MLLLQKECAGQLVYRDALQREALSLKLALSPSPSEGYVVRILFQPPQHLAYGDQSMFQSRILEGPGAARVVDQMM
jgi:hypothetical protein